MRSTSGSSSRIVLPNGTPELACRGRTRVVYVTRLRACQSTQFGRVNIKGSGRSSSVGESTRLISAGSTVRICPPAPQIRAGQAGRQDRQDGPRSFPSRPSCLATSPSSLWISWIASERRSGATGSLTPRTPWLPRLSGGSDSVALAHLLARARSPRASPSVGLAHFNHQLRAHADRDEPFCVEIGRVAGPAAPRRSRATSRASHARERARSKTRRGPRVTRSWNGRGAARRRRRGAGSHARRSS